MDKLLPKSRYNPNGFTLVELLVVISIIAILSVIGITLFSNVQKGARDAKRRADIDSIAKAMEANYNASTGQYAGLNASFFSNNTIPTDPINSTSTTQCGGTRCEYCAWWPGASSTLNTPGICDGRRNGLGANQPGAGISWYACTNLEVTGSGPGGTSYYCKSSAQ